MFCQNCGTQVEEGAAFCPQCGNQIKDMGVPEETVAAGKEGQRKKKKRGGCLKYVLIVAGIFLMACIGLSMCGRSGTEKAGIDADGENRTEMETDYISMIQTGHFGGFTDATVKEILDMNFGLTGFVLDWTASNMDGQKYVGFHAYIEGEDLDSGTILLFKVCTDGTFKVSGYAEGDNEDFEMLQIAERLNGWYMNWYIANRIGEGATEDQMMEGMRELIQEQFDKISGSAVLYGASADYTGDRGKLCKVIDGSEPLEMTVTELINYYNDNMLDIYTEWNGGSISRDYPEEGAGLSDMELQYGYYCSTDYAYAAVIEFDGSLNEDVFYLYEYSISDSVYHKIWNGFITPNGDGSYEAGDADGLMALNLTFDQFYMDIVVDRNDMDGIAGLEGTYEPTSDAPVTADADMPRLLNSGDLRGFARDNDNIGKTVSFAAEVSMSSSNIYLLNVFDDNGLLQIQADTWNGLNLFKGDKVIYTGVYNGVIPETSQLSFRTVSVELQ